MNAKKLLLLFLCIANLPGIGKTTDPPSGAEIIELIGSLDANHGVNGVEAYVYQNTVYVYFHQNYGNVSISLYNELGVMVYNDVVNTAVQQTVIIPIPGSLDFTYTLVLENNNGYVEGELGRNP